MSDNIIVLHSIVVGNIPEIGVYMTMMLAFFRVNSKLYGFIGMLQNTDNLSLNAEKSGHFLI